MVFQDFLGPRYPYMANRLTTTALATTRFGTLLHCDMYNSVCRAQSGAERRPKGRWPHVLPRLSQEHQPPANVYPACYGTCPISLEHAVAGI